MKKPQLELPTPEQILIDISSYCGPYGWDFEILKGSRNLIRLRANSRLMRPGYNAVINYMLDRNFRMVTPNIMGLPNYHFRKGSLNILVTYEALVK